MSSFLLQETIAFPTFLQRTYQSPWEGSLGERCIDYSEDPGSDPCIPENWHFGFPYSLEPHTRDEVDVVQVPMQYRRNARDGRFRKKKLYVPIPEHFEAWQAADLVR